MKSFLIIFKLLLISLFITSCQTDNEHKTDIAKDFKLEVKGSIRMGPAYYSLFIDKDTVSQRTFGDTLLWKKDLEYCAIQEWLTLDYQKGPITSLTVIDPIKKQSATTYIANKGFVSPILFAGNKLYYKAEYFADDTVIKSYINLDTIQNWKEIKRTITNR